MDNVIGFPDKADKIATYKIVYNDGEEETVEMTSFGVSQDNSALMVFFNSIEEDYETPPFLLVTIDRVKKIQRVNND